MIAMKIALLTPTFHQFSGIDRVVEMDAQALSKKGHEVTIFALSASIKTPFAKVIELGMPKNQGLERIYRLLFFLDRKKIRDCAAQLKDFDVVISHFYPMNIIAAYAKKKYDVKYVYKDYGVASPRLFTGLVEREYMFLFNKLAISTAKKADEVVSISRYLSDVFYDETGIRSRVEYIPFDKKRFNAKVKVRKGISQKYKGISHPILLYVGRVSPHKGIHLLIDSFSLVLREFPDATLIIAGKPTFKGYFEELKAKQVKNVIFAGFVDDDDLPSYYRLCDVYTTCTLWEGYDLPVVEAQACSKYVVAFDIGPHPETVRNGTLVKEGDVNAFSQAVIGYLRSRKQGLKKR